MELNEIREENHLRNWLTANVNCYNLTSNESIGLDWIEPGFGSTMGASDCVLTIRRQQIGVELKHFQVTSKGVFYKIRPVQRKYNFLGVTRDAKKLVVLATINHQIENELVIIRGDKVPMRDYAIDLESRCTHGVVDQKTIKKPHFNEVVRLITSPDFWYGTKVKLFL